jgi:hypothetical protein
VDDVPGGAKGGHGDVRSQPGVFGEGEELEHVNVEEPKRSHRVENPLPEILESQ